MSRLIDTIRSRYHVGLRPIRRLLWAVVILSVCWVAYRQIGDHVLLPIAQSQVRRMTGASVEIGEISFRPSGTVKMRNVTLFSPEGQHYQSEILTVGSLDGRFSLWSILCFKPRLKWLTIRQFRANAQYDMDANRWNLEVLNIAGSSGGKPPRIRAKDGQLSLQTVSGGIVKPLAIVGINGTFAAVEGQEERYDFHVHVDEKLGFGGSEFHGQWTRGATSKLSMAGQVVMGDAPIYGNSWHMRDMSAEIEYTDKDMSINKFDFSVGQAGRISVVGQIRDYHDNGQFELGLKVLDLNLSAEPQKDSLVYTADVTEMLGGLGRLLEKYRPHGRGDIELQYSGRLGQPWSQNKLAGVVRCKNISVMDVDFPYRLDGMAGLLEISENSVTFRDLKCSHDEVVLNINGYSKAVNGGIDCDLRVRSENMQLGEDIYNALDDRQKELWFTFAPEGLATVDYRLRREPGKKKQPQLSIELLGASAVYQHFPYPLKNMTGRVFLDSDRFVLDNVVSKYDGKTIALNGEVTETSSENPRFNIVIDANNIAIDETLKAALTREQREFYESFEVNAITDVRIKIFPNEVGRRQVEYIAWATVRDASLVYEKFPLPLTGVSVDAVITPDVVVISEMIGYNGQGQVRVTGKVHPASAERPEAGFCLEIQARGLELKKEWLGSLPERASEVVRQTRPSGKVNIDATVNLGSAVEGCVENKVVITCLGNGLNFVAFPYPIEDMTGKITIADDVVYLTDIYIPAITIDDKLGKVVTGTPKILYEKLKPTGRVSVHVSEASYWQDDAQDNWVEIAGDVNFYKCGISINEVLSDVDAVSRGRGLYKVGEGLVSGEGVLECSSLKVKGREIVNVQAGLFYDPNEGTFKSREFTAHCHGGRIMGDVTIHRPEVDGVRYAAGVMFEGIRLEGLMPEKFFEKGPSQQGRSGKVSGSFEAGGVLGSSDSHLGRFTLNIADAQIARRSLLGKVLAAMQFDSPTDYIFDSIDMEAYLKGTDVIFEKVSMAGQSTAMEGHGRLDLTDFTVNMDFTVVAKHIGLEPSFLESLVDALGGAMVKVKIRGDVDDPTITTEALPAVTRPFAVLH